SGSHSHSPSRSRSTSARSGPRVLVVGAAVALVAVAVGVTVVSRSSGKVSATPTTAPSAHPAVSKLPLNIVAVNPVDGASGVPSNATVSVQFSVPLSAHSPAPTLTPPVAGTWQQVTPTTMAFVSPAPLVPSSAETITVPAGTGGILGAAGQTLAQGATVHFGVAPGSTLRLQQLLAQLGYLPVSFVPAHPLAAPQELAQPQEGTFTWRFSEPSDLVAQWTPGASNVLTKGAIMRFEDKHGMTTDGQAGPGVWSALLADVSTGAISSDPYNYVLVTKALPQRATVYSNGAPVYSTLANTGVAAAPTDSGTFPVFEHLTVTTMRGTNPDGSKYVDPGIPWVSYFNGGDALHGFDRPGYGYPQSVGCVELPPSNAAVVFPYTPIGTLVTVA
ncbi:MAG TPA: L,D-transpeptidase family protein, partial [Acidimicrobiales bacterium]